jgi:hypothetical protein
MPVTWAKDDPGTSTTYASAEDVRTYLGAIAPDIAGNAFAAVLSDRAYDERIEKLLLTTKLKVDHIATRDLDFHEGIAVAVDGTGTQDLSIGRYGFQPLLALNGVTLDGSECDVEDFVWYSDGRISFAESVPIGGGAIIVVTDYFRRGRQNVELNIDWGYETVPEDAKMAQAYFVGMHLLNFVTVYEDQSTPGLGGGYASIAIGDMRINMGEQSSYIRLARWLEREARRVLQSYTPTAVFGAVPRVG